MSEKDLSWGDVEDEHPTPGEKNISFMLIG